MILPSVQNNNMSKKVRIKTPTNPRGILPGDILIAKRTIRYCMGQISSDKICRNEEVEVEFVEPFIKGTVTLTNHADRYGPYYLEDFRLKKEKNFKFSL